MSTLIFVFIVGHIALIEVVSAGGTLVVFVEPGHDAVHVKMMRARQKEHLGTLGISIAANGAYFAYTVLLGHFYGELLHVFVFYAVHILDLLIVHLVNNVLIGLKIHAIDRRLSLRDGVLGCLYLPVLILIIHPIQIVFAVFSPADGHVFAADVALAEGVWPHILGLIGLLLIPKHLMIVYIVFRKPLNSLSTWPEGLAHRIFLFRGDNLTVLILLIFGLLNFLGGLDLLTYCELPLVLLFSLVHLTSVFEGVEDSLLLRIRHRRMQYLLPRARMKYLSSLRQILAVALSLLLQPYLGHIVCHFFDFGVLLRSTHKLLPRVFLQMRLVHRNVNCLGTYRVHFEDGILRIGTLFLVLFAQRHFHLDHYPINLPYFFSIFFFLFHNLVVVVLYLLLLIGHF